MLSLLSNRWFCIENGSTKNPPVLLIHGFPSQAYSYRKVLPVLSKKYNAIAVDWLGFGFSDKPQPGYGFNYTLDEYVSSFESLVNGLSLDKSSLVVQGVMNVARDGEAMAVHLQNRWTSSDPRECQRIYIPLNDNITHWYLLTVSFVDRAAYLVDTLPGDKNVVLARTKECKSMLNCIQKYMDYLKGNESRQGTADKVGSWEVTIPRNGPDQAARLDGSNYGIYVIHFMLDPHQVPHITSHTVVTAKHRMYVMVSLLLWSKNILINKMKKRACTYCES